MTLPVIVTPPGAEWPLPKELGFPVGSTWRLAECLGSCFFVALATADTFKSPEARTLIVCWDSDLLAFAKSAAMSMKLHALQHVRTEMIEGQPRGLTVKQITEIWLGVDREAQVEVIIFKAADGSSFCGIDGIPVPSSVHIDSLAAAIPTLATND
jgi:hypothetical protein